MRGTELISSLFFCLLSPSLSFSFSSALSISYSTYVIFTIKLAPEHLQLEIGESLTETVVSAVSELNVLERVLPSSDLFLSVEARGVELKKEEKWRSERRKEESAEAEVIYLLRIGVDLRVVVNVLWRQRNEMSLWNDIVPERVIVFHVAEENEKAVDANSLKKGNE